MRDARPAIPASVRSVVPVACAVVILTASLVDPGDAATATLLGVPVTTYLHLLAYAGFTVSLCYAIFAADTRALVVAATIAIAYGGVVELLQGIVPYRTTDALDVLTNAIGAGAGAGIWHRVGHWFGAAAVPDSIGPDDAG